MSTKSFGLSRRGSSRRAPPPKAVSKTAHCIVPTSVANTVSGRTNPRGIGGDVHITSGTGGVADGKVYIEIGGEPVVVINEHGLDYNIYRPPPVPFFIKDVLTSGSVGVVTLEVVMENGSVHHGVLLNTLLKEDSWINLTAVFDDPNAIARVCFSNLQLGQVQYHIYCYQGELNTVQLHYEIRNNIK